jgi:hypothetical protein
MRAYLPLYEIRQLFGYASDQQAREINIAATASPERIAIVKRVSFRGEDGDERGFQRGFGVVESIDDWAPSRYDPRPGRV